MKRNYLPAVVSVLFGLFFLALIFQFSPNFTWRDEPRVAAYAGDFVQEYVGGHIVRHDDHTRFYDISYAQQLEHDRSLVGFEWPEGRYLPMIYPPFYYLVIAPFSLLPLRESALLWFALMGCLLGCGIALLAYAYPGRQVVAWSVPVALLFGPMILNLTMCQKATVLLLILAGTFLLLDRGKPFCAGLVFGLIAFKPQLALVIGFAMLLKRQWPFVLGSMVTVSVLIGLCFAVGSDVCRQYFEISKTMGNYINTRGTDLTAMHCWYGFCKLLFDGMPMGLIQAVTLALSAGTIALLTMLLWGPLQPGQPLFAYQFAGLVIATVLLSPHLLTYDVSMLLLPMFLLFVNGQKWEAGGNHLPHQQLLLAVALYLFVPFSGDVAAATRVQGTVLLMIALLATLAWQSRSLRQTPFTPA